MHYQVVSFITFVAMMTGNIVRAQNPTCKYGMQGGFDPKDNYAGEMQVALSEYRVDNPLGKENNVTAGATMGWFKGWDTYYSPGPGSNAIACFDMCQPCLNAAAASNATEAECKHYTIDIGAHSGNCWIGYHVVSIDWAVNQVSSGLPIDTA